MPVSVFSGCCVFFFLDLFNSTFLADYLAEVFCDFFFSAWGIIKVSPGFPAEPTCNHISLFSKPGAAMTAWRTSGSWACSLTSPAAPCTSPSPPASSRFRWDVASATANAKSTCFVVAVRGLCRGEAGALMNASLCSSLPRACIASRDPYCGWVKESGACTQLVLGSK